MKYITLFSLLITLLSCEIEQLGPSDVEAGALPIQYCSKQYL